MKLAGKRGLVKNTRTIELKQADGDITLKVNPLPLGWFDRIMRTGVITAGDPPIRVVEEKGKIKRDDSGHAVTYIDDRDQAYINRKAECGARLMALKAYFHLKDDNGLELEKTEPQSDDEKEWVEFGNYLVAAFRDFGFTDSELVHIGMVGDEASIRYDIEEISKSF